MILESNKNKPQQQNPQLILNIVQANLSSTKNFSFAASPMQMMV